MVWVGMNRLLEFCWRDDFLFSFFVATNFIISNKTSNKKNDVTAAAAAAAAALFVLEIQRDQLLHQL